ncbi:DUF3817 domain-containing protein [Pontibacillus salicampi]|uniref:DUF3817 domain-containing protein n=1 Tax=Pontibacillus salicampi TaxID=1449801 RepID=A0ABV6LKU7_9BACI
MLSNALNRFRLAGMVEGGSLLFLVLIAMPLKYFAGLPEVVTVVGSIHGFFFITYCLVIAYTTFKIRWSFSWVFQAFIVAFIPFGNIWLDQRLKKNFAV